MLTADYNANLLPGPALEDRIWGPADILRLEDQAGIDRAIIVPACQVWPDNEGLTTAIRGYDRLIGCAIINPQFGEKAVRELERCVREWGIKGLKLMPTFHGYPVNAAVVDPLVRKARDLGIPLTVHSGSWNAEPLQISVLADRYPEVPIIMEHSGYRWYLGDALDAASRRDVLCGILLRGRALDEDLQRRDEELEVDGFLHGVAALDSRFRCRFKHRR